MGTQAATAYLHGEVPMADLFLPAPAIHPEADLPHTVVAHLQDPTREVRRHPAHLPVHHQAHPVHHQEGEDKQFAIHNVQLIVHSL